MRIIDKLTGFRSDAADIRRKVRREVLEEFWPWMEERLVAATMDKHGAADEDKIAEVKKIYRRAERKFTEQ